MSPNTTSNTTNVNNINPPPCLILENEDWQVTREIYTDAIVDEQNDRATLHIPISLVNMIAIRILAERDKHNTDTSNNDGTARSTTDTGDDERGQLIVEEDEFQIKPLFQYLILSELTDPPIVTVTFHYPNQASDCYPDPDKMEISILQYPQLFPHSLREGWTEWIAKEAHKVLEESMLSFSVCNFISHDAMHYFEEIVDAKMNVEGSAILFRSNTFTMYETESSPCWTNALENPELSRIIPDIRVKKKLPVHTPFLHKFARRILRRNWKKYYEYECPICFCSETCEDGVELPCNHFYCRDCLLRYAKIIVEDIQLHRTNPFICPIPTCKQNMNVLGAHTSTSMCNGQKGSFLPSCNILTKEQIERITLWKKDIDHPQCQVLTLCPLSSCHARGMRKVNNDATNAFAKCEACNAIFCELCLKRIPKNKLGYDHRNECDETKVLKLVRRYSRAAPDIQAKCHEKLRWIKEYASSREMDASAALWVKEFASLCPTCGNAIERSEGCFHMHCITCGTHFCYECGEEIFYPFYGTHHCWERDVEDMQFDLFG